MWYNGAMKMRVMIARRRYKDKVYETPLVVTSFRDDNGVSRNRTVLNLTGLPSHAIEAVRVALRGGPNSTPAGVPVRYSHSIPVGATHAVVHLLRRLGIDRVLQQHLPAKQLTAVLAMIVQRVTGEKAASKSRLCRDFPDTGLALMRDEREGPALKTWYEALDTLERARMEILTALFPQRGRRPRLFLYDITSSYFEGTHCPLAYFGYNRDGKKGKMQIVIGLMTDHDGKPLWVQVFEGNTADQTTVVDQIKLLRDTLGIQELVFVGDRGMLTHAVLEDIEREFDERKIEYITALRRQEMMELAERQDHPIQPELFDERDLCEVWDGPIRYVLCHNPDRRGRDAQMRERLLRRTEAKLESIQNNVATGRIKRRDVIMKRLFRWLNTWRMERFFQVDYDEGRFTYQRDADAIEHQARLDGCYVIKSNVGLHAMDKDEVVSRYKSLKHVELAFRTMKTTELETRPIRHWTPSRVKGHVFMCFLAYRVLYEARQRWACELERDSVTRECDGDSLREMWAALDRITAGYVCVANETVCQVGRITPAQKRYLEELRVPVKIRLGRE